MFPNYEPNNGHENYDIIRRNRIKRFSEKYDMRKM